MQFVSTFRRAVLDLHGPRPVPASHPASAYAFVAPPVATGVPAPPSRLRMDTPAQRPTIVGRWEAQDGGGLRLRWLVDDGNASE